MIDHDRIAELQEAFARALCREHRDEPDAIVYAFPENFQLRVVAGYQIVRPLDIGKPFPLWKLYIDQARILVDAYVSEMAMQNTADRVLADIDEHETRPSPGVTLDRAFRTQVDFGS